MKPNFALILSMDGIALLQRASSGWSLVGDAYPDSPDLASDMADLRARAERLAPGEATFKVVIPNEQIRYLSIPAGTADPMVRQRAVEAALDGATPYALDELAIDHTVSGNDLQIAAVALETIEEADEFARGHGFDPVSFVAMPEGREFSGEPFFGTAHDLPDDISVFPDATPIRVLDRVVMPDETASEAPSAVTSDSGPEIGASTEAEPEGPISFSSVRSNTSAAPDGPEVKAPQDADAPTSAPRITFAEAEAGKAPAPVVVPPRDIKPEELSDSLNSTDDAKPAKPRVSVMQRASALVSAAASGIATRIAARQAARADAKAKTAEKVAESAAKKKTKTTPPPQPAPVAVVAAQDTPKAEAQITDAPKSRKSTKRASKSKGKTPVPPTPVASTPASAFDLNVVPIERTESPDRVPGALTAEERRAEAERLTVFGARQATYTTESKGSVGLAVAVMVAVLMAGSVGWAMLFSDDSLAALVAPETAKDETVAALPGPIKDAPVPPGPGEAVEGALKEPTPEVAATDQDAAAPIAQNEEVPAEDTPAPSAEDIAVKQALESEDTAEDATNDSEADSPLIVTEAATAPPEEATQAEKVVPSADEDAARYAASGIWQNSPEGLTTTEGAGTDTGTSAAIGPEGPPTRRPATKLAGLTPDARPSPPAPPPVFGQRFNMDARGIVVATPEGAKTPSGIMAFAGKPPVVPPTRPGDPEPAPQPVEQEPETQDSTEVAPTDQPDASVPATDIQVTEDTQAETEQEADPQFAGIRPQSRPGYSAEAPVDDGSTPPADASDASLAGDAVNRADSTVPLIDDTNRASLSAGLASGAEVDEDAADSAEEPAIEPAFTALRPLKRPGNISDLAAAARATPEPAPAIAPSGPTSNSVARQATLRGAIDLTEVNLIGVYGQPSDRRALVRLANGRYRKVKVGDRIDGGRVLAIGDDTLRYQKGGRNLTLNMPSG
jgi:hypothetical protein